MNLFISDLFFNYEKNNCEVLPETVTEKFGYDVERLDKVAEYFLDLLLPILDNTIIIPSAQELTEDFLSRV